jgi:magnesium transporter
MYLTSKLSGNPTPIHKHEEVEVLLETYFTQLEDSLNRIKEVNLNISSTKEFLQITLDSVRNRMMYIELRLQMGLIKFIYFRYIINSIRYIYFI